MSRFHLPLTFFLLLTAAIFVCRPGLMAQAVSDASSHIPWELEADRIVTYQDAKIVEAYGTVVLTRGKDYLAADYARFYWDTDWLYLEGDVQARWGEDLLEAESAELDLENNVGWLTNGTFFFAGPHMHVSGEKLHKTGEQTYTFRKAKITACDEDVPSWSFYTKEGKVTIDGYANLYHPRFRIKDVSVLYSPYLIVPVKITRQSGFLMPEISSSSRHGVSVNLPYYWVLGEEYDATFFENYLSKRGLMQGLEFRMTPDILTKGLFKADYLRDPETAETESSEDSQFQGDGLIRPRHERYWFRAKYNGYLADPLWRTQLDLDWVSDQNYLREFKNGYSGFERSRELFLDEFGRNIEDSDDLTRTNTFILKRSFQNAGFNFKTQYTQNLNYLGGNGDIENDPTVHRLPELSLDVYRTKLLATPLEGEMDTEAVYFWRHHKTTGTRLDFHPQVFLPVDLAYLTVTPRAGWHETVYFIDEYEDESASVETEDRTREKGVFNGGVDLFSEFFRIYDTGTVPAEVPSNVDVGTWSKLKHLIQARVQYDYVHEVDQSGYPSFDSTDRISPQNEITYSLVNLFTRRKDTIILTGDTEIQRPQLNSDYLEFLRFELEQTYDFREENRDTDSETYERRPFSDILAELTLKPGHLLSLTSSTWYSPYDNIITEHEHMLNLSFGQALSLYFGLDFLEDVDNDIHRKNQERLNIMRTGGDLKFLDHWLVSLDWRRDLEEEQDLENAYSIAYDHQCYRLQFSFTQTPYEDRFEFKVDLKNLGM